MKRRKRQRAPPRLSWPVTTLQSSKTNRGSSSATTTTAGVPGLSSSSCDLLLSLTSTGGEDRKLNGSLSPASTSSRATKRRGVTASSPVRKNAASVLSTRRPKRSLPSSSSSSSSEQEKDKNRQWVDKYEPQKVEDLCVNKRKIKEVKEWMEASLSASYLSTDRPHNKLLVLLGPPGVGKSTVCRVLAKEMNVSLLEWNNNAMSTSNNANHSSDGSGGDHAAAMPLPYESGLSSFESFLKSAGSARAPLTCLHEGRRGRCRGSNSTDRDRRVAIIVIDEIPNLHSPAAELQFRSILASHVRDAATPTVVIDSSVSEGVSGGGGQSSVLTKHLDAAGLLPSPFVTIVSFKAVPARSMTKVLRSIFKKEGLGTLEGTIAEEIYEACHGDVRHAVATLQFRTAARRRRQQRGGKGCRGDGMSGGERDLKLSTFHALGKLLYAKRRQSLESSSSGAVADGSDEVSLRRPWMRCVRAAPLEFDPEWVISTSDLGRRNRSNGGEECNYDGALSFLASHSPDFFTREEELSRCFDLFSDAALFSSRVYDSQRDRTDKSYPNEYVASLSSRAVAACNEHPAPNKYRPLTAPRIYDVFKKRDANSDIFIKLSTSLFLRGEMEMDARHIGGGVLRGGRRKGQFVTEVLPFLRLVLPREVNNALSHLHSYVQPREENVTRFNDESKLLLELRISEQKELLANDDIIDDDDDGDDVIPHLRRDNLIKTRQYSTPPWEKNISKLPPSPPAFENIPSLTSEQLNDGNEADIGENDSQSPRTQDSDVLFSAAVTCMNYVKKQPEIIVIDDSD